LSQRPDRGSLLVSAAALAAELAAGRAPVLLDVRPSAPSPASSPASRLTVAVMPERFLT